MRYQLTRRSTKAATRLYMMYASAPQGRVLGGSRAAAYARTRCASCEGKPEGGSPPRACPKPVQQDNAAVSAEE
jgi:hypothetical protein